MTDRVRRFFANRPKLQRLGVAVSGGADSVCLLTVLRDLAPEFGWRVTVVHFNHKLRGAESDEDEAFVRDLASQAGLACLVEHAPPFGNSNLEQAARDARRAFFGRLIGAGQVERIATAHTKSDQAETVLFRLIRGSGPGGLRGILPETAEGLVRPLLDVSRAEVETHLRGKRIVWREDSSNLDPRFSRNRIRHQLLPQLREDWNPEIDQVLSQYAELAADEEAYWNQQVPRLAEPNWHRDQDAIIVDARFLANEPKSVARRIVRYLLAQTRGDLRSLEFSHIESVLGLAASPRGAGRIRLPGVEVIRSYNWLRFSPERLRPSHYAYQVAIPGKVDLKTGPICLELIDLAQNPRCAIVKLDLNADVVPRELELRNWRPGDRYQPAGDTRPRKLKELLEADRVPLWKRGSWPILVAGDRIVWAGRFGPAAGFEAGSGTERVVRIVWMDERNGFLRP